MHELYTVNDLSFEVSLNWILGYLSIDYCKQISPKITFVDLKDGVKEEIPESTIEEVYEHIGSDMELEQAINLLLLNAFILGGNE